MVTSTTEAASVRAALMPPKPAPTMTTRGLGRPGELVMVAMDTAFSIAEVTTARFTGWPDEALEYFEGLEADNSKAYWQDHRDVYDRSVRGPMERLIAEVSPEFGP